MRSFKADCATRNALPFSLLRRHRICAIKALRPYLPVAADAVFERGQLLDADRAARVHAARGDAAAVKPSALTTLSRDKKQWRRMGRLQPGPWLRQSAPGSAVGDGKQMPFARHTHKGMNATVLKA